MGKLNTVLQKLNKSLRDNLFPEKFTCHICGVEIFEDYLCPDCLKAAVFNDRTTCPVCGRRTGKAEVCLECKAHMPAYKRAVSVFVYEGTGGELVVRFKNGKPYMYSYLARLLAEKIAQLPAADGIVFVPMTKRAERARGYNQSRLLADEVSALSGIPVVYGAVEKTEETVAQKGLSRAERMNNLKDCFKADKRKINGKTLLIIDDVMTTGATLDCLSVALKKAGAAEIYAATVASVEYKTVENTTV